MTGARRWVLAADIKGAVGNGRRDRTPRPVGKRIRATYFIGVSRNILLEFPVMALSRRRQQGDSSSAVEGTPAVGTRWRHRRP